MCCMAMSGGDAWFRNVPAEQVEQPGSGGEGWDLFSFVSEKWLCPSCAWAGAGVAAKVLPAGTAGGSAAHTGWTHTHTLLRGLCLVFLFCKLFIS